jgi:hypothetical protein
MLKKITSLVKLPSPSDLGHPFGFPMDPKENDYTYEDYIEELKTKYPFKYFLNYVVWSNFKRSIVNRAKDAIYWLKCKLLSSHKYHIIDLRNPNPATKYTYGWLDQDTKMLYACFQCLRDYVEKEKSNNNYLLELPEEEQEMWSDHIKSYHEINELYNWWMVSRDKEHKKMEEMRDVIWAGNFPCKKGNKRLDYNDPVYIEYREYCEYVEKREQEMLERLIKVRGYLWT